MVIITIGLSVSVPSYLRNMRQGEVDRYTQQLEAGFFSLRAKLGQQKTSCTLNFNQNGLSNFVAPSDLLEMPDDLWEVPEDPEDLVTDPHPNRIECCNSDIEATGRISGCSYGPWIGKLLADESSGEDRNKIIRDRSLRLLNRERTPESKMVEVSVNLERYELTPPGTSSMSDDLIFLIRSTNKQEQRLRTRCLKVSGTGKIVRSTWKGSSCAD